MNAFIAKKIGVMLIVPLVAFIAFGYLFLMQKQNLSRDKNTLSSLRQEVASNDQKIQNLSGLAKNKAEFEKTLQIINTYLPDTIESSEFVIQMENLAKASNIVIDTLSISGGADSKSSGKVKAIEFSATSRSNYGKVLEFISTLENLSRYNDISTITLSPEGTADSIGFKFSGKLYQYGQ